MSVPERDVVDRCFSAAHDHVKEAEELAANATPDAGVTAAAAKAIVSALEGVARQIRDADDTVATLVVPEFERQMGDLTIAVGSLD